MKPEPAVVDDGLSQDDEQLLADLLDEYVAAVERGESPKAEDLVGGFPELAKVLPEYLEGVRLLHEAMGGAPVVVESMALPEPLTEGKQRLGDYELLREVGRGGMGVVYEARQVSLDRRVAVKVLPFAAVLDERQIARFRTEAQAAAALHHPNIVPVFAVGQERGVHFYAMQYVDGQSLGQAIEERRRLEIDAAPAKQQAPTKAVGEGTTINTMPRRGALSRAEIIRDASYFRAVVQLGVQASEALEHAHQYGVVHRDIKPTNLLVDHRGKLWVTDFGLARVQSDRSLTQSGDVIGTLRYMSPEQASGRGDLVDGRTDVYALGATLYELLTLEPAHAGVDPHEITHRIQSADPAAPRRLNPGIPVDLETVVLRAMEKSRDDRYGSAKELRDDLQRFLDGRPTAARRPSLVERAGRWIARRRSVAAAAAAVLIVLSVVSIGSAVWIAAASQRTAAALEEAKANLALAQSHYRQARSAVDHFGGSVADRLAELPGADRLRHELLSDTLAYYQEFLRTADRDTDLRNDLAATHFKSGAIAHRMGDLAGSRSGYQQAVSAWRGVTDSTDAPTAESRSLLALGLRCLARVESEAGLLDPALEHFSESAAIAKTLIDENPNDPQHASALAEALANQGVARRGTSDVDAGVEELRRSVSWFEKSLELAPDRWSDLRAMAVAHSNLSELLRETSPDEARASSEHAVSVLERLVAQRPDETNYRADLAMACNNLAALEGATGDWRRAAAGYKRAAEEVERLVRRNPLPPRSRRELAITNSNLGLALARLGDHDASDSAFAKARSTLEELAADFPDQPAYAVSLAALWNNQGVALQSAGRSEQAITAFARASALYKQAGSGSIKARRAAIKAFQNHAAVLLKAGRRQEAEAVSKERRSLFVSAAPAAPETQTPASESL